MLKSLPSASIELHCTGLEKVSVNAVALHLFGCTLVITANGEMETGIVVPEAMLLLHLSTSVLPSVPVLMLIWY